VAQSSVNVTEGSGKRLDTWDRTISAVLVQDQFMLPGEYPYASYTVVAEAVSVATANDHVLQIMAGSTNYVRIRQIKIEQSANATGAGAKSLQILRLTTAGTGGTAITPSKLDLGDAAAGATSQTLPTVKGTESTLVMSTIMVFRQAISATAGGQLDDDFTWVQKPNQKPLIIPAGTSNGIAIKIINATAGASVTVNVEFVETAFLGA
jgi:hypothetical protein